MRRRKTVRPTRPPKPPDRSQNFKTPKPHGKFEWVAGHWRFDPRSFSYVWIKGHWRK